MQLKEVYAEILRVLKPGAKFCSYEWVSTKMYDPNNPQHVKVIDEINYGNGLPVIFCPLSPTPQLALQSSCCNMRQPWQMN